MSRNAAFFESDCARCTADETGLLTMKPSMEVHRKTDTPSGPEVSGPPREHWLQWANTLRRYQLDGFVAWLLDAAKPLAFLSAQVMYAGRPFLGAGADSVARLLESDDEAEAFAALLGAGDRVAKSTDGGIDP